MLFPIDVVKTHMQTRGLGMVATARLFASAQTVGGLYRGLSPALTEQIINRFILFGVASWLRQQMPRRWPDLTCDVVGGASAAMIKTTLLHPVREPASLIAPATLQPPLCAVACLALASGGHDQVSDAARPGPGQLPERAWRDIRAARSVQRVRASRGALIGWDVDLARESQLPREISRARQRRRRRRRARALLCGVCLAGCATCHMYA